MLEDPRETADYCEIGVAIPGRGFQLPSVPPACAWLIEPIAIAPAMAATAAVRITMRRTVDLLIGCSLDVVSLTGNLWGS